MTALDERERLVEWRAVSIEKAPLQEERHGELSKAALCLDSAVSCRFVMPAQCEHLLF